MGRTGIIHVVSAFRSFRVLSSPRQLERLSASYPPLHHPPPEPRHRHDVLHRLRSSRNSCVLPSIGNVIGTTTKTAAHVRSHKSASHRQPHRHRDLIIGIAAHSTSSPPHSPSDRTTCPLSVPSSPRPRRRRPPPLERPPPTARRKRKRRRSATSARYDLLQYIRIAGAVAWRFARWLRGNIRCRKHLARPTAHCLSA